MQSQPHRIAIASIKGGTGKTTTAVSLACVLARFERTLLIDFDPQAQVAMHFGLPQRNGVASWLSDMVPFESCLYQGRPAMLSLMPGETSSRSLSFMFNATAGSYPLSMRLQDIDNFTFQIYDTPAGGFLQEAALIAADHVIIPFRTEGASIRSLGLAIETIRRVARAETRITLLPVGYMKQYNVHKRNLKIVMDNLDDAYGVTEERAIPHRSAVIEAFSEGKTIWESRERGLEPVRVAYNRLASRALVIAKLAYLSTALDTTIKVKEEAQNGEEA